ncbi:MAG TPA: GNAT family N-acetyltransferase [Rhodobacteraceae bacterium]|nr:GNAT family N-acetyltransferase [Paracoccaceae bacterium]
MQTDNLSFAEATLADIPMLLDWMNTPDVRQWWGAPEDHKRVLEGDIANPALDVQIVSSGQPFALVQDYDAHHWPKSAYVAMPKGTRAMAAFIGVPALLGQGLGRVFIRTRANAILSAGAPLVAIDPAAKNTRAIRAYRAAGFAGDAEITDEDGVAVIPMTYKKGESP